MSNTSKGPATKGSKFWMQYVVKNLQQELNSKIGCDLTWISPLEGNNKEYLEYELKQDYMCKILNISAEEKKEIFSFWPNRQPQWDGIAITKDNNTLYLVEAKAHLSELKSKIGAKNPNSKDLILKTMKEVFENNYPKGSFPMWTDEYYQLANRLTFLHKLNDKLKIKNINVKLVLLNFVGDYTYRPTSEEKWNTHYKEVFVNMIGIEIPNKDVIVVNFPVGELIKI